MDDDLMNDVMDVLQELCDGLAPFRSVAGTAAAGGAIEIIAAHQARITQLAEDLYDCLYRVRETRRTATARNNNSSSSSRSSSNLNGAAGAVLRGPLAFAEPSPMALSLLVRKLGDVLESAHSVRVLIDTHRSELYSPPARSPGALPPLRPSAAMAEFQRGEFVRMEQALAGLDAHLLDAQRLLRIAYPAPFMQPAKPPAVDSAPQEASPDMDTSVANTRLNKSGGPLPSQWRGMGDTLRVSSSIDSGTQLYEQNSMLLTTTDSTAGIGVRQYQTESVESLPLHDPLSQTERYLSVSTPRASTSTLPYVPFDGSSPPRSLSASVDRARSVTASRLSCPQVGVGSALSAALLPTTPRSLLSSPLSGRNTLVGQPTAAAAPVATSGGSREQRDGGEVMEDEAYHGRQSPGRLEESLLREASPTVTVLAKTQSDSARVLQTVLDACSGSSEEREDLSSHSPPPSSVQLTSVAAAAAASVTNDVAPRTATTTTTSSSSLEQTGSASPPSARGLPPRAPSLPPMPPTTARDEASDATRVTTRHTHCLPGALWADILARQRARLERTLVTDIVDLLNYGQEAPLVTAEDLHELHFSLAGNYLYLFFTLTHPDVLMETEINMRVSLCAFPALNALYDEYAQHASSITTGAASPALTTSQREAASGPGVSASVQPGVGEDSNEVLTTTQNDTLSSDRHSTPPPHDAEPHKQEEEQRMLGDELFAPVPTVLTPRRTTEAVTTAVAVAAAKRRRGTSPADDANAVSPVQDKNVTRRTRSPAVGDAAAGTLLGSDTAAVVSASTNSNSESSTASSQATQKSKDSNSSSSHEDTRKKERSASGPTAAAAVVVKEPQKERVQHCSYVVAGKAWPQVLSAVAPDKLLAAIVADLTSVLQLPVSALQHISIPAPVGGEQRARLTELPIEFDLKLPADDVTEESKDTNNTSTLTSKSESSLRSRLQRFDFPVLHTLYRKTLAECELKSPSAAPTVVTMSKPPDLSEAKRSASRRTKASSSPVAQAPTAVTATESEAMVAQEATQSSSDATPSFVTSVTTQLRAEEESSEHAEYEGHTLHDVLSMQEESNATTLHRVTARAASSTSTSSSSSTTVMTAEENEEDTEGHPAAAVKEEKDVVRSVAAVSSRSSSSSSSSRVVSNRESTPERERSPRPDQAPRPWPTAAPPVRALPLKSSSTGREGSLTNEPHQATSATAVQTVSKRRRVIAAATPLLKQPSTVTQVKTTAQKPPPRSNVAAPSPLRRSPSPMPPATVAADLNVPHTTAVLAMASHERRGSSATQESGSRRSSDTLHTPPLQPRSWCPTPHPTLMPTTNTTTSVKPPAAMPTLNLTSMLSGTRATKPDTSSRAGPYSARGAPKTARMPRSTEVAPSSFRRTASAVAREHVERIVMHGRLSDDAPPPPPLLPLPQQRQQRSPVRQPSENAMAAQQRPRSSASIDKVPVAVVITTRGSGGSVDGVDKAATVHENAPRISTTNNGVAIAEPAVQYTSVASKHVDPLLDAVPNKVVHTARLRPTTFTRSVVQNYREQHTASELGSQSRDNSLSTVNSVTRHTGLLARQANSRRREPQAVPFSARTASTQRSRLNGDSHSAVSSVAEDTPASRQIAAIERAFGLVVSNALCVQQAIGLAAAAHIARGDVVRTLNGHALRSRGQLLAGLAAAAATGAPCVFMTLQNTRGALFTRRVQMPAQALPPLQPDVLMTMMHDDEGVSAQTETEDGGVVHAVNTSRENSLTQMVNSRGGAGGSEAKDRLHTNGHLGSESSSALETLAAESVNKIAASTRRGGYIAVTSRPVERPVVHLPVHNAVPLVSRSARPCSTTSPVPRHR